MAEATGISWADATFNPWVGCSKVSPGCVNCYAESWAERYGRATWGDDGERRRTSAQKWRDPIRWNQRALDGLLPDGTENRDGHRPRIFCASLADVFEPRPELEKWRLDLFELIEKTPALDWLLLTKRPEVARDWLREWYFDHETRTGRFGASWVSRDGIGWGVHPNVWIGASIENARFTYRADVLREIPAMVRFLSCEPLVGSLYPGAPSSGEDHDVQVRVPAPDPPLGLAVTAVRAPLDLTGIDWVIVGGESGGRKARPMHPAWAREIRDAVLAMETAGYPCPGCNGLRSALCSDCESAARERGRPALHFKQWGSWTPDEFGRDPNGLWIDPTGRGRSSLAADAYDDLPNGSMRMRYAGPGPKSGGKLLDGVDFCEFPEPLPLAVA